MRKQVATVFNYSLDGLLADEGTEFFKFCLDLIDDPPDDPAQLDFLQSAYAHIMGHSAYEGMATALPANPDHPWADVLNAGLGMGRTSSSAFFFWPSGPLPQRGSAR